MKFKINKSHDGAEHLVEFETEPDLAQEKITVLDALIDARNQDTELAFRYGCRNRLCGVCTVKIDGKPRLACRTPARENMLLEAAPGLPVLQDLVVRRDGLNRQLNGKLPTPQLDNDSRTNSHEAYDSLGRCIECYACLNGCPLHAKNNIEQNINAPLKFANPYGFLRIQRSISHPATTEQQADEALGLALDLGLDTCIDCDGCTCGVGIDLIKDVIDPLLKRAKFDSTKIDSPER